MKKETIQCGQIAIDFLLEAGDANGSASMFEFNVPVGAKVPLPHYHEHFDEVIYGLAGVMTFSVDDKFIKIAAGDTSFIPRGAIHGFDNLGQEDAKALAVITPVLLGPNFFKEMGVILNSGGPPVVDKLKQIMAKHGLVPVMPKIQKMARSNISF